MKTEVRINKIEHCARCGQNHLNMTFKRLARRMDDLTHWAPCPINGDPIMMEVYQTPVLTEHTLARHD